MREGKKWGTMIARKESCSRWGREKGGLKREEESGGDSSDIKRSSLDDSRPADFFSSGKGECS